MPFLMKNIIDDYSILPWDKLNIFNSSYEVFLLISLLALYIFIYLLLCLIANFNCIDFI